MIFYELICTMGDLVSVYLNNVGGKSRTVEWHATIIIT